MSKPYERIYTVGCFDWFHKGHCKLFENLRKRGHIIIAGVHDDASLECLKNLNKNEHQCIAVRMANVKRYADVVFLIDNVDPTFALQCIVQENKDTPSNACFIRANDMLQFPGRDYVQKYMNVEFVPYTHGISSTIIRTKQ